jgi:tRNA-2-methylthio-N6-dimethylallyladenosine synthase
MRYHVWTEGCQMNVADSRRVAAALEQLGYQSTDKADEAEVIVLNTCVVRQSAEDKAYGRLTSLRPIKARRPDVTLCLMGCLVGVRGHPQLQQTFPFVDVFAPPSDPAPLIEFLLRRSGRSAELEETRRRAAFLDGDLPLPQAERGRLVSAFLPIVLGCSHACTFCVIPYRRGVERSRPPGEILAEVRALADQGVREVTLLGQIVDRYGKDLASGLTLIDLLRQLDEIDNLKRIRFLTSHPNWMTDELLDAVAELPKVCEHIEVPVQAGDDAILEAMQRGYTADDFRRLVERIRRRVPGASIATDVIVGFPGESAAQFQHTFDLMEELRMDVAHLARYSERPGTVAARRLTDDVDEAEKLRRFRLLETLQEKIAGEIHAAHVGQTVEVLVEEEPRGRWKGRTRTNKLVFFEAAGDWRGRLARVRITWAGPWSMRGEVERDDGARPAPVQLSKSTEDSPSSLEGGTPAR